MGRRNWKQKTARVLASQFGGGYQRKLNFICEHSDEILALAARLQPPTVAQIPGVGSVRGSRVEATEAIWDKYHDPPLYQRFLEQRGLDEKPGF